RLSYCLPRWSVFIGCLATSCQTVGLNSPGGSDLMKTLNSLEAEIVFLQETHVGPEHYQMLENVENGQRVDFSVYDPRSKGVAILTRQGVPFEYTCHREDYSGGCLVLFCHLYGELHTLVNVYNHNEDRKVLYRLKDYLKETAEGVLVVGGAFNTVLDHDFD
uniref:Endonuclease/exonuclease/phosphatase domain-containing protein n=1 Tax=Electrophorus electricus TaxID=8005 RepID=A0AAY5EIL0_ELEEL